MVDKNPQTEHAEGSSLSDLLGAVTAQLKVCDGMIKAWKIVGDTEKENWWTGHRAAYMNVYAIIQEGT